MKDGEPFVCSPEEMARMVAGGDPEKVMAPPTSLDFDIPPKDAVRLVSMSGKIAVLQSELAHARTLFGVVLDSIRRSANLPEGADFKTDDTGLKGHYDAPKDDTPGAETT